MVTEKELMEALNIVRQYNEQILSQVKDNYLYDFNPSCRLINNLRRHSDKLKLTFVYEKGCKIDELSKLNNKDLKNLAGLGRKSVTELQDLLIDNGFKTNIK